MNCLTRLLASKITTPSTVCPCVHCSAALHFIKAMKHDGNFVQVTSKRTIASLLPASAGGHHGTSCTTGYAACRGLPSRASFSRRPCPSLIASFGTDGAVDVGDHQLPPPLARRKCQQAGDDGVLPGRFLGARFQQKLSSVRFVYL